MNLKSILNGLAILLPMALASQAATPTILDSQFNNGTLPSSPADSPNTVNNTGGDATLNITGTIPPNHYYFNARPSYGTTERGTWDTFNSQFILNIGAGTTSPGETLAYTLTIDQFYDGGNLFPAALSFSIGTPESSTRTVLDSTPTLGQWVEDVFTWHVTPTQMLTPLSVTISADPTSSSSELFFDRVRWDIVGDIAVPEPGTGVIAGLGLLAFGLRNWFRRKV